MGSSVNKISHQNNTLTLVKMIGSPFAPSEAGWAPYADLDYKKLYDLAFENRVELLYLKTLEKFGLLEGFKDKKNIMELRCTTTRKIAAMTSRILTEAGVNHVVFKSIKPYPATPNDTDIVCLGDEKEYQKGLSTLTDAKYVIQAHAPLQTLLYHPWGEGKVGSGKKGGTYYIDFYRGIGFDYYEYVNKTILPPYCEKRIIENENTVLLSAEPELAIVMFHNVFPEKTFQLEHFYLCLHGMANPEFDMRRFVDFTEKNFLTSAVRSNLTIIEMLHKQVFEIVPEDIEMLLNKWGREESVIKSFRINNYHTTYMFPAFLFWRVFLSKQRDPFSRRSLLRQGIHMMNPVFFRDALKSAWRRTFEKDIYEHQ